MSIQVEAYQWPPDGIVDRDLDIAISQFAPASETVKDGVIHTAVGVVDYQPQGNSVVEQANPLGPPIPIGMCRRCQGSRWIPERSANVPCLRSGTSRLRAGSRFPAAGLSHVV